MKKGETEAQKATSGQYLSLGAESLRAPERPQPHYGTDGALPALWPSEPEASRGLGESSSPRPRARHGAEQKACHGAPPSTSESTASRHPCLSHQLSTHPEQWRPERHRQPGQHPCVPGLGDRPQQHSLNTSQGSRLGLWPGEWSPSPHHPGGYL